MTRFEYYRRAKGFTQAELARRVGTTQANISMIENGREHPRMKKAIKIAEILETTVDDLFKPITF